MDMSCSVSMGDPVFQSYLARTLSCSLVQAVVPRCFAGEHGIYVGLPGSELLPIPYAAPADALANADLCRLVWGITC